MGEGGRANTGPYGEGGGISVGPRGERNEHKRELMDQPRALNATLSPG